MYENAQVKICMYCIYIYTKRSKKQHWPEFSK